MVVKGKGLKFIYVNIRSLYKNKDELFNLVDGYDIICVGETWLSDKFTDNMIHQPGYKIFRYDRQSSIDTDINRNRIKTRGGGLLIYVCDKLSSYCTIICDTTSCTNNLEQMWICIEHPNMRQQTVSACYRPPNGSTTLCIQELSTSLDVIIEQYNAEITILGDLNMNYKRRSSAYYKQLKDFEKSYGLRQLITKCTRITKKSKTLIDLIFTNIEHVSESGTMNNAISDHQPIYLIKKKPREKHESLVTRGRSYADYNKIDYQQSIKDDVCWLNFWMEGKNVNELWHIMYNSILIAANKHCPERNMRLRNVRPGWMTIDTVEAINDKYRLYRLAKCTKTEQDWVNYKQARKHAARLLKNTKEQFIVQEIDNCGDDSRKLWRELHKNLGSSKINTKTFETIKDKNSNILSGKDAYDYLNDYFTSVPLELSQNFGVDPWTPLESAFIENDMTFDLEYVTKENIKKLIKEINIHKSSATPRLSSRLLKDAFEVLYDEICHMLNKSLSTGEFPDSWCIGHITPLPKTGNLLDANNWRPISQIPLIGKLLEKIVNSQLQSYLYNINVLNKNQFGFIKNKSTSHAVFKLITDLYDNVDRKHITQLLYIDYRKAFDTIDHGILIKKLHKYYNFSKKSIRWFNNYLTNRQQKIVRQNQCSTVKPINIGVPQGSILGPTLFIMFVNDLFNIINRDVCKMIMYADDTVVYTSSKNIGEGFSHLERNLCSIIKWCNNNKLTLNVGKTKHMVIGPTLNEHLVVEKNLQYKDQKIEIVSEYNYLGIDLDNKLTMENHINKSVGKANKKLYMIYKIRKCLSKKTTALLYKQLVRPHLEYCDFLIDSSLKKHIEKFDRVQKRALRTINYGQKVHKTYAETMLEYDVQHLHVRRKEHLIMNMFSQRNNPEYVDTNRPDRLLRNHDGTKFKIRATRNQKVYKSPYFRGVQLWGQLPNVTRTLQGRKEFKHSIKGIEL